MAQYFFKATPDVEGAASEPFEIATVSEARRAAVIFASEIIRDSPDAIWRDEIRVRSRARTD